MQESPTTSSMQSSCWVHNYTPVSMTRFALAASQQHRHFDMPAAVTDDSLAVP